MKLGKTLEERIQEEKDFIKTQCGWENRKKKFALFPKRCENTKRFVWLEYVYSVRKYNNFMDESCYEYYEIQ